MRKKEKMTFAFFIPTFDFEPSCFPAMLTFGFGIPTCRLFLARGHSWWDSQFLRQNDAKRQNQDGFRRFWVLCAAMNHLSEPNCGAEKNGKSERSAVFLVYFPSHFRVWESRTNQRESRTNRNDRFGVGKNSRVCFKPRGATKQLKWPSGGAIIASSTIFGICSQPSASHHRFNLVD